MNVPRVPSVTKRAIGWHYDLATPFYRWLWGVHIHHGLWEGEETPEQAQQQLIERLASAAGLTANMRVLDVGCGMGGSSIYLARQLGCQVTGLTLSRTQLLWARLAAWRQGVHRRVTIHRQDAETASFAPASFDALWSIECTEHLFDRGRFFQSATRWLRPGGRVGICAWLAGDRPHSADTTRQIDAVCTGFLCPSLGTADDYLTWMREAGLAQIAWLDWTNQVTRTWEICLQRVQRSKVRHLAWLGGRAMTRFLDHFDVILQAYRSGAMKYGCFTAQRPEG